MGNRDKLLSKNLSRFFSQLFINPTITKPSKDGMFRAQSNPRDHQSFLETFFSKQFVSRNTSTNKENDSNFHSFLRKPSSRFSGPSFFFALPVVARTVTNYYRRSSRNKQPARLVPRNEHDYLSTGADRHKPHLAFRKENE